MASVAPTAVRKPDRRHDTIPLATEDQRRYYDQILKRAAAIEGLFPVTPAGYAQAAGVAAGSGASR